MTTHEALERAEALLQPIAGEFARPAPERLDAMVAASELPRAVEALRGARFGYLSAITGLDVPPVAARGEAPAQPGQMQVLYHFCEGVAVVTLRVTVSYDAPRVPSICQAIPAATLFERELAEMFGISVEGTPDPSHLLLPEQWPDGVYPLRKAFTGK